jgi:hypothetical protein
MELRGRIRRAGSRPGLEQGQRQKSDDGERTTLVVRHLAGSVVRNGGNGSFA